MATTTTRKTNRKRVKTRKNSRLEWYHGAALSIKHFFTGLHSHVWSCAVLQAGAVNPAAAAPPWWLYPRWRTSAVAAGGRARGVKSRLNKACCSLSNPLPVSWSAGLPDPCGSLRLMEMRLGSPCPSGFVGRLCKCFQGRAMSWYPPDASRETMLGLVIWKEICPYKSLTGLAARPPFHLHSILTGKRGDILGSQETSGIAPGVSSCPIPLFLTVLRRLGFCIRWWLHSGFLWEEALGTNSQCLEVTLHNTAPGGREGEQQLRCVLGAGVLNLCALAPQLELSWVGSTVSGMGVSAAGVSPGQGKAEWGLLGVFLQVLVLVVWLLLVGEASRWKVGSLGWCWRMCSGEGCFCWDKPCFVAFWW